MAARDDTRDRELRRAFVAAVAASLCVSACAHGRASSPPLPPPAPPPCEHEKEIAYHWGERQRLAEEMHTYREKSEAAERALEAATTEEEREALRADIEYFQGGERIAFTEGDKHYFAAERLEKECENPTRRRASSP